MTYFILTRMLIYITIKIFKANLAFYYLFKSLFSYTHLLIKNVGIIPVTLAFLKIYTFLKKELKFKEFPHEVLIKLNPVVINNILSVISNDWDTCIKNVPIFKKLFKIFLIILFIDLIKHIIWNIIKFLILIILLSILINLNETFSTITILKTLSDYVLYFLPIMPTINNFIDYFNWIQTQINIPINNSNYYINDNDIADAISFAGLFFIFMIVIIKIGNIF